jgi:sterol 14-demethylase
LAAVIEEQKQIIKKYGDYRDYDVLLEMDTLHRSIKEALRYTRASPCRPKKATSMRYRPGIP